jgi:hypothetical protein
VLHEPVQVIAELMTEELINFVEHHHGCAMSSQAPLPAEIRKPPRCTDDAQRPIPLDCL